MRTGLAGLSPTLLAFLLAGCAQGLVPTPGTPLARCGADRLIGLIGGTVGALPPQPLDRSVRILRPGDAVTEDYSDRRLNVILDGRDRITALSCG